MRLKYLVRILWIYFSKNDRESGAADMRGKNNFTWSTRADGVRQFGYISCIVTNNFRDLRVRAQKTGNHVPGVPHLPLRACFAAIR